jgi:hypothetical protein
MYFLDFSFTSPPEPISMHLPQKLLEGGFLAPAQPCVRTSQKKGKQRTIVYIKMNSLAHAPKKNARKAIF